MSLQCLVCDSIPAESQTHRFCPTCGKEALATPAEIEKLKAKQAKKNAPHKCREFVKGKLSWSNYEFCIVCNKPRRVML